MLVVVIVIALVAFDLFGQIKKNGAKRRRESFKQNTQKKSIDK
jgi:hypothetical protein